MPYVKGDPYWLNAKYPGNCSKCNEGFLKGSRVFYYPKTKDIYYRNCAEAAAKDFNDMSEMDYFGD